MKALRAAVSGSRVRYMQDGYDLDLTYITPRLIAMGYPAAGVEKTYRNNIAEVAEFLNSHHPETYRVFNLSERKYDYARFDGRVTECGFPDHHPPPLQILLDIMNDMLEWTARSPKHVVVVHCLAGKGRTGVVCSCYLLLVGFYGSIYKLRKEKEIREVANRSIRDFWNARGQGVRFPSQALYIYYFIKVLRRLGGRTPTRIPPLLPPKRMHLTRVVLHGIPDFDAAPRGGIVPFLQVLPAPSQHEQTDLLYNSSWQQPQFETYTPDPNGCIVFNTNCEIRGDVLVRAFHASTSAILGKHFSQIFHFTFNTDFLRKDSPLLRLHRDEIDDIGTSSRFPSAFRVDCEMEPIDDDAADNTSVINHSGSSRQLLLRGASHQQLDATQQRMAKLALNGNDNSAPPTPQNAPIMGWLYKQGGFVKNWKKRWFVARDGKIMYFHGASDPTPLGTVDLRRVVVDVCDPHELNARNQCLHYFKVVPPQRDQRTYYFGADTEQEMVRWIRALGAQSGYGASQSNSNARTKANGHNSSRGRSAYSASVTDDDPRSSFRAAGASHSMHNRLSDSRVAYDRPGDTKSIAHTFTGVTSPPGGGPFVASSAPQYAAARGGSRSSRGHNATELTYTLRQSIGNGQQQRDSLTDLQQQQRQSSMRNPSFTRTANVEEDDDDDDDETEDAADAYLHTQKTLPATYVASKPIAFDPMLSDNERLTILQEVENFHGGNYVYTADELAEIAKLQTHLRTTPARDHATALSTVLARLVAQRQLSAAEELLVDAVIKFFPRLVDAMDYDPLAFTQMVVDTQQTDARRNRNGSVQRSGDEAQHNGERGRSSNGAGGGVYF